MKKAFTLIELLVVIAIIAILAAILFPVFAQAKAAAKKAAGISNQKQISLGIIMYGADADDMYPRNDDCVANSSLNPALNNIPAALAPNCAVSAGFAYRVNHFSWQKWTMPYVKNIQLYFNTSRGNVNAPTTSCPGGSWAQCGQITGSYLLNSSLTGQLNTWGDTTGTRTGAIRDSWLGGSMTSLPNTGAAGILMESGNLQIGVVPIAYGGAFPTTRTATVYPAAVREFWALELLQRPAGYVANWQGVTDENRAAFGGIIVGSADGGARFMQAQRFLANCPTAAEYGVSNTPGSGISNTSGTLRGYTGGTIVLSAIPNLNANYPMWALGQ
ncbi:MAG: prepilin-type N-terminal cleavage/methylation domain-containing protein [Armatimonadota bacterium]